MTARACDRCGTPLGDERVMCPTCDAVVEDAFLAAPTLAKLRRANATIDDAADPALAADDLSLADAADVMSADGDPLDDALESPTVPVRTTATVTSQADAAARHVPAPIDFLNQPGSLSEGDPFEEATAATQAPRLPSDAMSAVLFGETNRDVESASTGVDAAGTAPSADPFAPAHTAKIHRNRLFRSATDAIVLGDAGDIAESVLAEQPGDDGESDDPENNEFLTAATSAERRVFVPVLVHIGRDIARHLRPAVVLREVPGAAARAPLSPFERFVLREVDGARPIGRIQARMGVSMEDLRLALALLLDKAIVEAVGLVRQAGQHEEATATAPAPQRQPTAGAVSGIHEAMTLELPAPQPHAERVDGGAPSAPLPQPSTRPAPTSQASVDDTLPTAPAKARSPRSLHASMLEDPPAAEPIQVPGPPSAPWSTTDAPRTRPPTESRVGTSKKLSRGFVVADAGRSQAASLYDQCLRDIKNGELARAWQLACMAQAAAPEDARYQELIDDWVNVVERHKTADDARHYAQAVRAESLGDVARALQLLRLAVEANASNAAAWNRLGLLLARSSAELPAAVAALEKAVALVPSDATFRSNLGKVVAAAERRGIAGLFRRITR